MTGKRTRYMQLTGAYIDYLKNRGDRESGPRLVSALKANGYEAEGYFLHQYYEGRRQPLEVRFDKGLFTGRKVYIGSRLPENMQTGEIWFDVWEIMPMVRRK